MVNLRGQAFRNAGFKGWAWRRCISNSGCTKQLVRTPPFTHPCQFQGNYAQLSRLFSRGIRDQNIRSTTGTSTSFSASLVLIKLQRPDVDRASTVAFPPNPRKLIPSFAPTIDLGACFGPLHHIRHKTLVSFFARAYLCLFFRRVLTSSPVPDPDFFVLCTQVRRKPISPGRGVSRTCLPVPLGRTIFTLLPMLRLWADGQTNSSTARGHSQPFGLRTTSRCHVHQ
ncbi:hypothetical protein BDP55DRAFT_210733 [Colletotrichum godetiae]|uniref:Uncharacterized protein n=1 Tax=Colletotrichum godetiae TaxID=1209918 RepID=A0AAJ0AY30_9PEZI|nr:uncharacterized protein BDP55DRAFT_210733 [Colletotrichum godetiae]KAK1699896.1 hypothetical protein BDP55DRAFT_210733 [Colletotrichum godetiae]